LVFNEAKKDAWAKSCYELLNKIREAYQSLVNTVEEQCSVKNAIRDLEIRVNAAISRNFSSNTAQLQADLEKIKQENAELQRQAT
jgi:translation initiation factor 2B subunit (eIF-2B alpha/beta/delta family)